MIEIKVNQNISSAQMRVLAAIVAYMQKHGYAPTLQEIADDCGLKSRSNAKVHVKALLDKGILESDHPGHPRALRLKNGGRE